VEVAGDVDTSSNANTDTHQNGEDSTRRCNTLQRAPQHTATCTVTCAVVQQNALDHPDGKAEGKDEKGGKAEEGNEERGGRAGGGGGGGRGREGEGGTAGGGG